MLDNEEESRNCNECCEKKCPPKVATCSYEFSPIQDIEDDTCEEKKETKAEMLQKIRCLDFAVVELAEYLDTHNDDKKAHKLHKEYSCKIHDLKEKYQKMFGPLSIYFPCNKWRWIEEPWPWERGNK